MPEKPKKSEPSIFEYQLSQYETDLKSAQKDGDEVMVKEISKYIRNLKEIIKCLKARK